ncbi:MAG: SLAC1 anion channel family protein [Candidatus Marinimicrobia bacterium]|nr:SLAC1 anion channel family protein [Candidatus Neomarinimicrobiota bacterium]
MSEKLRLRYFPISFFSVILGMAGFTIAFQRTETALNASFLLSNGFLIFTVLLFAVFILFYLMKMINYFPEVLAEFRNPLKLSFFPTTSISLLLLSILFLTIAPPVSKILWMIGSAAQLLFTVKIITIWIHHDKFEINHMNPGWFIPAVGNLLVPVSGVAHFPPEISWFFYSIGIMFWGILLVIFINRIIFHSPLPERLLPTLFILIAPPAIGFVSYVRLAGSIDAFAYILYYFALFMFILLFTQIRLFSRIRFYLSWWAYSFPLAAITIASFLMHHETGKPFFSYAAYALFAVLSLAIAGLLFKTLISVIKKEICIAED